MAGVDQVVMVDVGAAVFRRDRGDQLAVAHPEFGQGGAAFSGRGGGPRTQEQLALPRLIQIRRLKSS